MAIDRTSDTEYGGGSGIIPSKSTGHEMTAGERAMLMRTFGNVDYNYTEHKVPDEDGNIYPETPFVNPERDRVEEKMNNYNENDL